MNLSALLYDHLKLNFLQLQSNVKSPSIAFISESVLVFFDDISNLALIKVSPLASGSTKNVVPPLTVSAFVIAQVPSITALLTTLKPVPDALDKVNVSAISAVLFKSNVPAITVLPEVSATVKALLSQPIPPLALNTC